MNYVPVVAGTNSNDFVGTEESIGAGHSSKEIGSSQDCILMPLWKDGSLFDSSSKNASNDEPQPSSDAGKKDDGVRKESGIDNQERPENSTQDINNDGLSINTASTNITNGSLNINTVRPIVTTARSNGYQTELDMFSLGDNATLEATHADFFGDETEVDMSNITTTYPVPSTPNTRIHKDHSLDHVIGDVQSGVQTRRMTKTSNEQGFISAVYEGKTHEDLHTCLFACFLSQVEPKKKDERGIVIRNKARLVAQGYTQEEGIDYDEIEEEVYVCQPLGFEDPEFLDKVFKVEKALYGLHQAPRACNILLVQVYVDDIIFGSTKKELCTEFGKLMHKKFQMSSMGELTFFLGLQVSQKDDGIFISQDKYVDEILNKFGFSNVKTVSDIMFAVCACARFQVTPKVSHLHVVKRIFRYLKGQPKLGLWYPKDSPFDLEAYSDSDYTGASLDRKSITGGCQFLGSRLILWQCKKQTIVVNFTTKAEYVVTASCCGQVSGFKIKC
ncbi:putative ribonuclease H-like domain-containing protein, partial [Tanacetum coccineum]